MYVRVDPVPRCFLLSSCSILPILSKIFFGSLGLGVTPPDRHRWPSFAATSPAIWKSSNLSRACWRNRTCRSIPGPLSSGAPTSGGSFSLAEYAKSAEEILTKRKLAESCFRERSPNFATTMPKDGITRTVNSHRPCPLRALCVLCERKCDSISWNAPMLELLAARWIWIKATRPRRDFVI